MAYQWQQEADREGMGAKIPKGRHRLRILKIHYENRDGQPFMSQGGDPQIQVIYQDAEAREASEYITLSHKAGFRLAKLMAAFDPPANLARMESDGIEPGHFAHPKFADEVLLRRELVAEVDWEPDKHDPKKEYARITPLRQRAAAGPAAGAPPAPDAPPAAEEMPASDAVPPVQNKDEAWEAVVALWSSACAAAGANGADAKNRRNAGWLNVIKEVSNGRKEKELTPADWQKIVGLMVVPF